MKNEKEKAPIKGAKKINAPEKAIKTDAAADGGIGEAAAAAGQLAENENIPAAENDDRRDAEAYRELMKKQRDYEDSVNRIVERWKADSERLKEDVPEFDLTEAMQDAEFKQLVISGMNVDGAYYALRYKEVTGARRPIMQNAYSQGTRSGSDMNDIMSMDNKSFRKQIRKMMEA